MQYYSDASLITPLKGTEEQALALDNILSQTSIAPDLPEGPPTGAHGLRAQYQEDTQTIHICNNEDDAYPNELTTEQIDAIRQIILQNHLDYIEFGIAHHASRPAPAAFDGGRFRIFATAHPEQTDEPQIIWPDLVWPEPSIRT